MKRKRHFETAGATALREATVIRIMLDDLDRTVRLLQSDIAAEEERTRVFDISDPLYSMLGRTLVERRDNVSITVATLTQRLSAISPQPGGTDHRRSVNAGGSAHSPRRRCAEPNPRAGEVPQRLDQLQQWGG